MRHVTPVVPASIARTCFMSEGVWWLMHAAVADDGGDERSGGDVEGGVVDVDLRRRGEPAESTPHFVAVPLLDLDRVAARRSGIERARGGSDVERNTVMTRGDRDGVGADLVRGVA